MGLPPIKIYKHAIVFIEYLTNIYTILQISAKSFVSVIQHVVQETMQFTEQTRKESSLICIMNKLELLKSMAQKHML